MACSKETVAYINHGAIVRYSEETKVIYILFFISIYVYTLYFIGPRIVYNT